MIETIHGPIGTISIVAFAAIGLLLVSLVNFIKNSKRLVFYLGLLLLLLSLSIFSARHFLVPPLPPFECVVADQLVSTPEGVAPIEELEIGDHVISLSSDGTIRTSRIDQIRTAQSDKYIRLSFDDDSSLAVTQEHPVAHYTGWVKARSLKIGDQIVSVGGTVTLVKIEHFREVRRVYDLTTTPDHNFFVEGILLHNKTVK
jgi:hypothetical protein